MAWVDDFFGLANDSNTTNRAAAVKIFYIKTLLRAVTQQLQLIPFGQRVNLPKGRGKIVEWTRYLNIPKNISNRTLTEGTNPDATVVGMQKLQTTIAEFGGFSQETTLLSDVSIDEGMKGLVKLWGEDGGVTIDSLCHREVCSNGVYPMRADASAANVYTGQTVDSATATTLVDATLNSNTGYGDANDDLNQSIVIITSGTGYGQARIVTDFVTSGGTMTISPAWDVVPVAGDTYRVASYDDITTSDKLTYLNVKAARTQLVTNRGPKIDGKNYVCLVGPQGYAGLADDTDWKQAKEYSDVTDLYDGELGKLFGVRIIEETNQFRFPIETIGTAGTGGGPGANGANESATGGVEMALFLAGEAFGVTRFVGEDGLIKPTIIMKKSGPQDTSNPLDMFMTVGWKLPAAHKALNPMFAIGMGYGVTV